MDKSFYKLTTEQELELDTAYFKERANNPKLDRAAFREEFVSKLAASLATPLTAKINLLKENVRPARLDALYRALDNYAKKFPDVTTPNIVLCGATGTGKTHAATLLCDVIRARGFWVEFTTAFNLVRVFQSYVQTFGRDDARLNDLIDCDFLVIDDLGTEPMMKNITLEHIYNVINERQVHGRALLVTTNFSPAHILERYDQRIASRLFDTNSSIVIELKGDDLRVKGVEKPPTSESPTPATHVSNQKSTTPVAPAKATPKVSQSGPKRPSAQPQAKPKAKNNTR